MFTNALYLSTSAFAAHNAADKNIFGEAQRNNPKYELTGCLLRSQRLFLQVLEGPEDSINLMMNRIRGDMRHIISYEWPLSASQSRFFSGWSMAVGYDLGQDGDAILTALGAASPRPIKDVAEPIKNLFEQRFKREW